MTFKPPAVLGFGVNARIEGWVDRNVDFNLEGSGKITAPGNLSLNANAVVSGKGVAACGKIGVPFGTYRAGIGQKWANKRWDVLGGNCDIGPYQSVYEENAKGARAAQAAQTTTLRVARDQPLQTFAFVGRDAPPKVTLIGPDGTRIVTPAGADSVHNPSSLIIQDPSAKTTHMLVAKPAAGAWKVELAPGSSPLADVLGAEALPKPDVKATIGGGGDRRTLRWRLTPRAGQVVRFVEEGPDVARVLGTTSKAAGRLSFVPGEGFGRTRRVVAVVEQDGLVRDRIAVARFAAPAPGPARPKRVSVRRSGSSLRVSWTPVRRVQGYDVTVRDAGGAVTRTAPGGRRVLVVRNVSDRARVRVSVRGFATGHRAGNARTVTLAAPRRKAGARRSASKKVRGSAVTAVGAGTITAATAVVPAAPVAPGIPAKPAPRR
jgi:hypothetical protein